MNEENYIKAAYKALMERGVITEDMLTPSTVTDEMLDALEEEFAIKLPSLLRTYFKTYCHNITSLCAAVPMDDICAPDIDIICQIQSMSSNEIKNLDEDEQPYLELWWCGILPIPQENPLGYFREMIEGFRETADYVEGCEVTSKDLMHFIPFADWQVAGAMCIDTNKKKEDISLEDTDTWQISWFDHEEFDWEEAEYISEDGAILGDKVLPDFESFIRLYFYGIYDELYCMQAEEEGEVQPDKSCWCESISFT